MNMNWKRYVMSRDPDEKHTHTYILRRRGIIPLSEIFRTHPCKRTYIHALFIVGLLS